MHSLAFIRAAVRWDIWYDSKVPLFFVCMYYAALSRPSLDVSAIYEMGILLVLLCLYASFGHLANSFSDRAVDVAAGKPNALVLIPEWGGGALVWGTALASLLLACLFYRGQLAVVVLSCFAFALAAFYSLPPVRFKERGVLGPLTSAVAQRTLPAVIVFSAMEAWNWTAAAICVLSTLVGLRYIIVHQIKDERTDEHAGVRTVATVRGATYLRRLLKRVVFPLELAFLGIVLVAMSIDFPAVGVMALVYAAWLCIRMALRRRAGRRLSRGSYTLLADFYYIYWPLLLAALLTQRDIAFLSVLVFNVVWQSRMLNMELGFALRTLTGLRWRTAGGNTE